MTPETTAIILPLDTKIKKAFEYSTGKPVKMTRAGSHTVLHLDSIPSSIDHIIECSL